MACNNKVIAMALLITLMAGMAIAQFDNPGGAACQSEVLETELQNCRQFMMQKGPEVPMSITNQGIQERCCNDLGKVKSQCRCDVIQEMMYSMQEEMQYEKVGSKTVEKMKGMAAKLPSICGISPGYCHFDQRS